MIDMVSEPSFKVTSPSDKRLQYSNNNAWNCSLSNGSLNNNNNNKYNNSYHAVPVSAYHKQTEIYSISTESIRKAYYDCRKNKRSKPDMIFLDMTRCIQLPLLRDSIRYGTYKPKKSRAFVVSYPVRREVFCADIIDRVVHHWIALRLEPLMEDEFIDDSYNCRKGKGTDYGIERIVEMIDTISCHYAKSVYVGKYDMRGYFMSIDKDILWDMIKSLIDRRYCGDDKQTLLYLTKETIYNIPQENCIRTCPLEEWDDIPKSKTLFSHPANKGLPIGNLTSQLFANYYFSDIDREMKERHEGYSRYVDDGTIIAVTVDEICDGFVYVRERSRQKGCEIHPNKFYIQPVAHGFKIIGRVIKPYRIYVSNRIRNKMRSKVIGFGKIRNVTRDVAFHLVQSMNSYLGLMNRLAAYNVKKENLEMIDPRYFEYIEIEGNYELLKMKKNGSKKNLQQRRRTRH